MLLFADSKLAGPHSKEKIPRVTGEVAQAVGPLPSQRRDSEAAAVLKTVWTNSRPLNTSHRCSQWQKRLL